MGILSKVTSEGRKLAASRTGSTRSTGGRKASSKQAGRGPSTSGTLGSLKKYLPR